MDHIYSSVESSDLTSRRQRKYNREFQKSEVVKYLVKKEPLDETTTPLSIEAQFLENDSDEGYIVYIYRANGREYEEGFGPSVSVLVDGIETAWKRSRNKWNPFEKIKTVPGMEDEDDFTVVRDKSKHTSYYLTERMYYYLDREKYKDKYRTIRAKLYITRVKRKGDPLFLLQFIMERLTEEEIECQRLKEINKQNKNHSKKFNRNQMTLPPVQSMNLPFHHVHPNLIEHFSSQYDESYDKSLYRAQTYPPTSPPSPPKYFKYQMDNNQNILKPLPIKPSYQAQNNFHPLPPLSQIAFQYPTYNHYQQQYFNVHNYSQPFSTIQPSNHTTNPLQYTLKFDPNDNKSKAHHKTRSMDVEPGRWRKDYMGEIAEEDYIPPTTERQQKRLLGTTFEERSVKRKSLDIESQNQLNKLEVNMNFPKIINQNSGGFV